MNKKLKAYRSLIISDDRAMSAFMRNPASELRKHAGKVVTAKQGTAIKNFFAAGTKVAGAFSNKAGKVGRAPKWLHDLVDWLWDKFF
jgi:hypothetical protein